MADLTGRIAIVTGGARLMARGVVQALHDAGAAVVVADVDETGGETARGIGERVSYVATDITDDEALTALVEATVAEHGGLDVVMNLAATDLDNGFETSRADWLTALDVNLVSLVGWSGSLTRT